MNRFARCYKAGSAADGDLSTAQHTAADFAFSMTKTHIAAAQDYRIVTLGGATAGNVAAASHNDAQDVARPSRITALPDP